MATKTKNAEKANTNGGAMMMNIIDENGNVLGYVENGEFHLGAIQGVGMAEASEAASKAPKATMSGTVADKKATVSSGKASAYRGSMLTATLKSCFKFDKYGRPVLDSCGRLIFEDEVPVGFNAVRKSVTKDAAPKSHFRGSHHEEYADNVRTGYDQLEWFADYIVRKFVSGTRAEYLNPDLVMAAYIPPYKCMYDSRGTLIKRVRWTAADATIEEWRDEVKAVLITSVMSGKVRYAVRNAFDCLKTARKDYEAYDKRAESLEVWLNWRPQSEAEMAADKSGPDMTATGEGVDDGIDFDPEEVIYAPLPEERDDSLERDLETQDLLNMYKREPEAPSWEDYDAVFAKKIQLLFKNAEERHPKAEWSRYAYFMKGWSPKDIITVLGVTATAVCHTRIKFLYWLLDEVRIAYDGLTLDEKGEYDILFKYGLMDPRKHPEAYEKPEWLVKWENKN